MGREIFVEEFMEGDFTLHKFLNHSRLLRLFRLAEDRDFFVALLEDMLPTRSTQSSQDPLNFMHVPQNEHYMLYNM